MSSQFGRTQGPVVFGKRQGPKLHSVRRAAGTGNNQAAPLSEEAQAFLKSQKSAQAKTPAASSPISFGSAGSGAGLSGGQAVAGRRFFSYVIDMIIFGAVWFLAIGPALTAAGIGAGAPDFFIANESGLQQINPDVTIASLGLEMMAIQFLARIFYSIGFEASGLQATPGKMALGLVVVNNDREKASLAQVIARNTWGRFISYMVPLGLGLLIGVFRQDKKMLHDLMASTLVCKKAAAVSASYAEAFA